MAAVSNLQCKEHMMAKVGKGNPDLVVYTCNIALQRLKLVDYKFKASFDYAVEFKVTLLYMRSCVKFPDNTPKPTFFSWHNFSKHTLKNKRYRGRI